MKIITETMFTKSILILLLFFSILSASKVSFGQDDKIYDHHKDTLIMVGELYLDTYKVLLPREQILAVDTLKVNKKGFSVVSFNFSALSLGANVSHSSKNGVLSEAMKNEIKNERIHYKFIYLKDIVLQSEDGKKYTPSLENIKITFSN